MSTPRIEKCGNCKDNYFIEDLLSTDKGNMKWLCQACFDFSHEGERV